MSGSAAEIWKQSCFSAIFPLFGVTVMSVLFGMCTGIFPKYHGRHRMSVLKFLIAANALLTFLSVYGGFMWSSAEVAMRASTKPIWLKAPIPKASLVFDASER